MPFAAPPPGRYFKGCPFSRLATTKVVRSCMLQLVSAKHSARCSVELVRESNTDEQTVKRDVVVAAEFIIRSHLVILLRSDHLRKLETWAFVIWSA